jgi:hypothetical protein
MKSQHTDIVSPPHWPQTAPRGYRNQYVSSQLEIDYSLAARNIYDVFRPADEVLEDVDGDEDIWVPKQPSTPITPQ